MRATRFREEGSLPLKHLPRKKIPVDIRSLCRSYTKEVIQRLAALARNPGKDEPSSTSVAAAALLMGYGWGKPHQTVSGEDGQAIEIIVRKMADGKD